MQTFCGLTTDGMLEYLAAIYRLAPISLDATDLLEMAMDNRADNGTGNRVDNGSRMDNGNKVTTGVLAEAMSVSPAAVSSMLRRLQDSGFVERSNTDGITLTGQGYLAALQLIRRHRLLEVFLMETLDFAWDQVDVEAHRLEHAISAEFEDRIDRLCGQPTHCPHGDPIPRKDGHIAYEPLPSLVEIPVGQPVRLSRVGNKDARILRYLCQLQIVPGKVIVVTDLAPFNGPVTLEITGQGGTIRADGKYVRTAGVSVEASTPTNHAQPSIQVLGRELAEQLFVTPLSTTPEPDVLPHTQAVPVSSRQTETAQP